MNRRSILKLAGAGALSAVASRRCDVKAQGYPSGPITLVVAWPAGGGSDISMRLLADALSKKINVPVVVLNKAGAGGAIGHREIATAKPDGQTIGMFSLGRHRAALPERAGEHDRRTRAARLLRRGSQCPSGQHRERHQLAERVCRTRPRQSRASCATATISPAAPRFSRSRNTRRR